MFEKFEKDEKIALVIFFIFLFFLLFRYYASPCPSSLTEYSPDVQNYIDQEQACSQDGFGYCN